MTNIFDVTNLDDIPPELIKELRLSSDQDNQFLSLFADAGGTLNLTQLLVGYYRKHKESKTRQYMMSTCYRLVQKKFLENTDNKGEYKLTEKGRTIVKSAAEEVGEEVKDEETEGQLRETSEI